jgi:septal ring factor EnvC (AmiA/AmiB activator)
MSIETIVAIVVPLLALCFTAMTFRRSEQHDTTAAATDRANLSADVRYIRSSIDEIKLENKSIQKDVSDINKKLVEVEAAAKSAHKRIDDIMKG